MSFLLRIYFFGMIAFVPLDNGEMSVLLVDVHNGYYTADDTYIPPHYPILLARGDCEGDCRHQDQQVANLLIRPQGADYSWDPANNLRLLERQVLDGAIWLLEDYDVGLQPFERSASPSRVRRAGLQGEGAAGDVESFAWVANLGTLDTDLDRVDPDTLRGTPRKGLVAARFRLAEGRVRTARRVAPEFAFKSRLPGDGPVSANTRRDQLLADWVAVDIEVPGPEATLELRAFAEDTPRTLRLRPSTSTEGKVVEIAVMNIPIPNPCLAEDVKPGCGVRTAESKTVSSHFEMFYELAAHRPSWRERPVPHAKQRSLDFTPTVQGEDYPLYEFFSNGSHAGGTASLPICPLATFGVNPVPTDQ